VEARRQRPVGLAAWRELAMDPWPAEWPAWPGRHSEGQAVNWPFSPAAAESGAGGPGGALRREWIATLDAALLLVGQPLAEIDLAVAARLRVALGELVEWGGEEWLSTAHFVEEITELLAIVRLAEPDDRPAVGLYRPEAVIGRRFQHLFILGMVEGAVADQPLLDLHERKRLRLAGLPLETAADLVRNEKLGLLLTCAAATVSITLSQPRMKGNEATIAAALLAGLIDCGDGTRAPLSLEEQRRAGQAGGPQWSEIQLALAVERGRELATGRDEYDGITGRGLEAAARIWSASQLTKFGQCRFRWFSQYLLGVEEDDELPEEVTARQYGRLFHRVLELALLDLPEGTDPREWALARLGTAFATAENDPENRLCKFPAWAAQRQEWLSSLREAIENEQFIAPEAAIIGREARFVGSWHGLRVNGSIDRIDRTAEGIEMVDYKTSSSFPRGARDGSGRLKLDLQLPIYIEAAGAQLFPDEKVTGRYYSLTRRQNLVRSEPADATQLEGFAAMVRQRLAEGDFAVDPDPAGEACAYCEFELICRRGPRLARKTGGKTGSPAGAEVAE
ncbi:MAG: PD-(D/E)XK nuclease family protein, partial [Acidobacteriota bacterium]